MNEQLQVGDICVIGNTSKYQCFIAGEIIEIAAIDRGDNIHDCTNDGFFRQWVRECDLIKVGSL